MQAEAEPHFVTNRSHDHFRLRVFSLDHRHDFGTMFWGDYISTHSDCPLDPIESFGRESRKKHANIAAHWSRLAHGISNDSLGNREGVARHSWESFVFQRSPALYVLVVATSHKSNGLPIPFRKGRLCTVFHGIRLLKSWPYHRSGNRWSKLVVYPNWFSGYSTVACCHIAPLNGLRRGS